MDSQLVSLRDAAAALGISVGSLRPLLRSGQLPSVRIGRRHLIPAHSVRAFAAQLVATPDTGAMRQVAPGFTATTR